MFVSCHVHNSFLKQSNNAHYYILLQKKFGVQSFVAIYVFVSRYNTLKTKFPVLADFHQDSSNHLPAAGLATLLINPCVSCSSSGAEYLWVEVGHHIVASEQINHGALFFLVYPSMDLNHVNGTLFIYKR